MWAKDRRREAPCNAVLLPDVSTPSGVRVDQRVPDRRMVLEDTSERVRCNDADDQLR
jgi:hypothetical protein